MGIGGFVFLAVLLIFPIAWFVAEFKTHIRVRLVLGVGAMVAVGIIVHGVNIIYSAYAKEFRHATFRTMAALILNGRDDIVKTALITYQFDVSEGKNPSEAYRKMHDALSDAADRMGPTPPQQKKPEDKTVRHVRLDDLVKNFASYEGKRVQVHGYYCDGWESRVLMLACVPIIDESEPCLWICLPSPIPGLRETFQFGKNVFSGYVIVEGTVKAQWSGNTGKGLTDAVIVRVLRVPEELTAKDRAVNDALRDLKIPEKKGEARKILMDMSGKDFGDSHDKWWEWRYYMWCPNYSREFYQAMEDFYFSEKPINTVLGVREAPPNAAPKKNDSVPSSPDAALPDDKRAEKESPQAPSK